MDWVLLIGRILFALNFIFAGLGFHLQQRAMATEYARSQGAPLQESGRVPERGLSSPSQEHWSSSASGSISPRSRLPPACWPSPTGCTPFGSSTTR